MSKSERSVGNASSEVEQVATRRNFLSAATRTLLSVSGITAGVAFLAKTATNFTPLSKREDYVKIWEDELSVQKSTQTLKNLVNEKTVPDPAEREYLSRIPMVENVRERIMEHFDDKVSCALGMGEESMQRSRVNECSVAQDTVLQLLHEEVSKARKQWREDQRELTSVTER